MQKFTVALLIILSFILYSFLYHQANPVAVVPNTARNGSSSAISTPSTSGGAAAPGATDTPGASSAPGALYKDGSYTGSVADAQWGYIQVKAVIQNGKITDVQFLQYPNDRNRSIQINNYADPQLTNEAIQVQSASVDVISGATDSSDAFIQSLSDALNQAKA